MEGVYTNTCKMDAGEDHTSTCKIEGAQIELGARKTCKMEGGGPHESQTGGGCLSLYFVCVGQDLYVIHLVSLDTAFLFQIKILSIYQMHARWAITGSYLRMAWSGGLFPRHSYDK